MFYLTTHSTHFIYGYMALARERESAKNIQQKRLFTNKHLTLTDPTAFQRDANTIHLAIQSGEILDMWHSRSAHSGWGWMCVWGGEGLGPNIFIKKIYIFK